MMEAQWEKWGPLARPSLTTPKTKVASKTLKGFFLKTHLLERKKYKNNLELRLCLILRCERSRLGLLLGSCGSINAVWAEGAQYTAQASPPNKNVELCAS